MRKVIGALLILGILSIAAVYADSSPPSERMKVLFHQFIMDGKIAHVGSLLQRYPELINCKLKAPEFSPLHSAALHNQKKMAEFLISKGAEVNARDKNGKTPLTYALMCEYQEMVDFLRAHGAHE